MEGRTATAWYGRVSSRIGSLPAGGIEAGRNQDATWNRKRRWSTVVRVVNPGSDVNPGGESNRWALDRGERLAGDRGGQPREGRDSAVALDRFRRGESLSNHQNEERGEENGRSLVSAWRVGDNRASWE